MNTDKLYEPQFVKLIVKDAVTYSQLLVKNSDHKPSDQQEYIHRVANSFSEIRNIIDNLEFAEIFLNSYSVSTSWKKRYNRTNYIRYHYEMWIMNLVRLYERTLILINEVYDLGIDHKKISYEIISSNRHLKNTPTLRVINKVHGALSSVQGLKNQVFHRSMYDDDKLSDISTLEFVAKITEDEEDRTKFLFASKWKSTFYLKDKKKEIHDNNEAMLDIVFTLLNTLDKKYLTVKESYKE